MIHLTPQQLSSYMDGELNEASTELVRRHMGACEECTLKFASLEVQEDLLSRALVHDPGEEFFEQFTADVARQIPGSKDSGTRHASQRATASRVTPTPKPAATKPPAEYQRPAAPPSQAAPSHMAPSREPEPEPARAEALESSELFEIDMVAQPDDDGIVTDERPTEVGAPAPPRRVEPPAARSKPSPRPKPAVHRPRRPAPSIPWYAALILAAISASVGLVVARTEPVSSWLDTIVPSLSPESPRQTPDSESPAAPANESAPAAHDALRGIESDPQVDDEAMDPELTSVAGASDGPDVPEPQPQEASRFLTQSTPRGRETPNRKDSFASVPATALAQVRAAQRSVTSADSDPSALRYEIAAADWDRAVPLLQGWQQVQGRFEVASARYRAWEMGPTAARATAAVTAIRSYMTFAAQGPARDQARAWMARLAR